MEDLRKNIEDRIKPILDKVGMYYRIFSRVKTEPSIRKKLEQKGDEYRRKGKKMQDLIGLRIVFYFQEDVQIFYERLKHIEGYDESNESNSSKELKELSELIESWDDTDEDDKSKLKKLLPFHDKVFMPERMNLVMQMNQQEQDMLHTLIQTYGANAELIDATFEIQLRTVLSEGWHEVEHDLRYKTKDEEWWNFCDSESRMLNGIYASLETNERALSQMIEEITYKCYKQHFWDAMIRFHFCMRMTEEKLPQKMCNILDEDDRLAKEILHVTKRELSFWLWKFSSRIPISTQLVLFLLNRERLNCPAILAAENEPIKMLLEG